jgi:hypothetical protein
MGDDSGIMASLDEIKCQHGIKEPSAIIGPQEEAAEFLRAIGLPENADAIDQLARVFVPCLTIMCERGNHSPEGNSWRRSGWKAQLHEVFKKVERLRWASWLHSGTDTDSAIDAINYLGFYVRGKEDGIDAWAHWGRPDD